MKKGVAPDFNTAYGMVRAGVNSTTEYGRLVGAEKNVLVKEPQNSGKSDAELEALARKNVAERAEQAKQKTSPTAVTPAPTPGQPAQPATPAPVVPQGPTGTTHPVYNEGDTATGPNGEKRIFQGGAWVPLKAGQ